MCLSLSFSRPSPPPPPLSTQLLAASYCNIEEEGGGGGVYDQQLRFEIFSFTPVHFFMSIRLRVRLPLPLRAYTRDENEDAMLEGASFLKSTCNISLKRTLVRNLRASSCVKNSEKISNRFLLPRLLLAILTNVFYVIRSLPLFLFVCLSLL